MASLAVAVWLVAQYASLPETVPTHFSVTGEPDAWGAKTSVLWLAGGGVVLTGLVAWLSVKPQWFNYPLEITEANAQAIYREGERMMVWLLIALVLVFAGVAMQIAGAPAFALVGAGLAAMPVVLVVGVVRMLQVRPNR